MRKLEARAGYEQRTSAQVCRFEGRAATMRRTGQQGRIAGAREAMRKLEARAVDEQRTSAQICRYEGRAARV